MFGNTAIASTQREPCALQHYLRQMNPKAPSYVLSKGECQVAFQHWVAYVRGGDHGYPSDITAKEHLRCPLLWCRESFDNLASTLQHVSECPWLSDAWYWCPYCCRPESFMASEEPCLNSREDKLRRKDSKLKRAVTFFKQLGHKSCSRHKISGSSAAQGSESFDTWFDTWLAEQQQCELEDTSHKISTRGELADSSSGVRGRRPYPERQAKKVYEMEGTTTGTPHDPDTLSRYTQEANPSSRPCELDVEPHVEPQFRAELPSTTIPFLGIGAQFDRGPHEAEPRKETNEVSFSHQSAEPITSAYVELDSTSLVHNGPEAVSSPEVADHQSYQENVTPSSRIFPLTSEFHGNLHDDAISTQSPVNDLRETVRILNKEWLQRCQSTSDILLRASALSPQSLLDIGAKTLRLVFQGVMPSTFDAVFALAHITCAAAYITHGDDRLHCWNEFLQNILDLQNLIQSKSDAQLFVQLVNLLCWRQCPSAQRVCGNYSLDESSGTLVPLRRPVIGLPTSWSTRTIELQASRHPAKPVSMTILRSLKDGDVIQECSRFLDGVEYAMILERSKLFPTHLPWYAQNHVANIEELLRSVIHPLRHCDGIEALQNTIDHTTIELKSGSLRSVREVEVSLISNGKSSCLSPKIYKQYFHAVTSICDRVMHEEGPNWRDRFYATEIDEILTSLEHIDNRYRRRTSVNSMPEMVQTLTESIPTPSSIESQTLIGSPLSAFTSPTVVGGYSPPTQSSSTTSPESSFSAPTPSSSRTDVERCPKCPAVFTGSPRDRASNLRRHMRTTREHGNAVGLLCPIPGCGVTLSRSDNLGKHIKTVHGGDTDAVLRRADARKRRRYTEGSE